MLSTPQAPHRQFTHASLFCGLGGGSMGLNRGSARVGNTTASFRCLGGIDSDPDAIRDFTKLTGTPGTVMDLFSRAQYTAFHGKEPPAGWREATPADIKRAFGGETPSTLLTSPPCKAFSGLMTETKSTTVRYQALNELTLRGIWLTLEAYKDDPVPLIALENVPLVRVRGRHLLDQITSLLRHYGYAVSEGTHDCGVIGNLAQSRKRFLMVARHTEKVPPLLYQPEHKPLRAVGEVLSKLPMPGDQRVGPMHRLPALAWSTWLRLALVEAGSDWRSIDRFQVEGGLVKDLMIVPGMPVVCGGAAVRGFTVADVRSPRGAAQYSQYGVLGWEQTAGTVIGVKSPGQGVFSVADPRRHAASFGKYSVVPWDRHAGTVIAGSTTGQGAFAVAGLRGEQLQLGEGEGLGDEGLREPALKEHLTCMIRTLSGAWHRPFTTLEMAALQSLYDPSEHFSEDMAVQREIDEMQARKRAESIFMLHGASDQYHRERIGNAIPPAAAEAIGRVFLETLLLASLGETFQLSAAPVWVRPIATALSVDQPQLR